MIAYQTLRSTTILAFYIKTSNAAFRRIVHSLLKQINPSKLQISLERLVLKKPGFVTVYSANGTKKFEQATTFSNLKIVAVEGNKIYVQPRLLVPPTIYIINTTQQ